MKERVYKNQFKPCKLKQSRRMVVTKERIKVSQRIPHKSIITLMKNLNPSRKDEEHQRKKIRVIFSAIIVRNGVTMLLTVDPRKPKTAKMKQSWCKKNQLKEL